MERTLRSRVTILLLAVGLVAAAIGARLYQLQVLRADDLRDRAIGQHRTRIEIGGKRGDIVDRRGRELAVSVETFSLYAHPHRLDSDTLRARAAEQLAPIVGMSKRSLAKRLRSDRPFVWIHRRLDPAIVERIEQLEMIREHRDAFGFEREPKRFYPRGRLAAHVIGFANIDQHGVEGVEHWFDDVLQGDPSTYLAARDGRGRMVRRLIQAPSSSGRDLVLTIDSVIQHIVERELDRAIRETGARSASAVVLEPDTGHVIALANRPTADLGSYGKSTAEERRNRAVVDFYEPGSTFKIVTAAAALEYGTVRPDQRFDCENGSTLVAGQRIRDHKPFGRLTLREILEKSSNVGIAKVCGTLRREEFRLTIGRFGFGSQLGIELPGEQAGLVRPVADWSARSSSTIAFGQEVGVTVLQMAAAFAALANDGVLVPPRIALGTRDAQGRVERFPAAEPRRVVEAHTARALTDMLAGVVEHGTGSKGSVDGYGLAGKTGTAQKAIPGAGYSDTDFVASFGGYGPVRSPRLAMMVTLDSPRGTLHQGGQVAAPVFARIMTDALTYLRVEPDHPAPRVRARAHESFEIVSSDANPPPPRLRTAAGQVPDVRGLSLRDAVSTLAGRGCRARVRGHGVVVSQSPPPGQALPSDRTCLLQLTRRAS